MSLKLPLRIFVEGKADEKFLSDLIVSVLLVQSIPTEIFVKTGGWTNLCKSVNLNEFRRMRDDGGKSLVIFDADADFMSRKFELNKLLTDNDISIDENDIFLFPNNSSSGDLESLLLNIANRDLHKEFFDCFDSFLGCLESYKVSCSYPVDTPSGKKCIFTYLDVHFQEAKEDKRDYTNSVYWDLNHPALNPLVNFLRPYFYENANS